MTGTYEVKLTRRLSPTEKLQALYESEINAEIAWWWDVGFDWALGDTRNGHSDSGNAATVAEAIEALWLAAKERYPNARCFK